MEYFIGEIVLFPYNFVPQHFAKCEGQLMSISNNEVLYSLLSNKFGGDGRMDFALPDLRGAEPIPGTGYYMALTGIYPARS